MKPSTIIILVLEILLLFALISACTPHLWNWTPLDFAHGGVLQVGKDRGDYDPDAFGSIVTEDMFDYTYFKFDKPYTDVYKVEVHCYDKNKEYLGFFVINDSNYQHPFDCKAQVGDGTREPEYYRLVLSYKNGKTYWSDWDLIFINWKFKFLTSEKSYNWFERLFLNEKFVGIDLGIWPFD